MFGYLPDVVPSILAMPQTLHDKASLLLMFRIFLMLLPLLPFMIKLLSCTALCLF